MPRGASAAPVPVTIVTGFLGAGKTTLVNRLLSTEHGERIAVIVNEFGAVGIDGRLIVASQDELVELKNGCICCTLRGDLAVALSALLAKRERRLWPLAFERVVIETSGLASPGPVLQTLALEAGLAERTRADGVITLVDATSVAEALATSAEAEEQVAHADLLLLNHADRADSAALAAAAQALAALNPLAPLRQSIRAAIEPRCLFNLARAASIPPSLDHAAHDPSLHGPEARSIVLQSARPLDLHALKLWLTFATGRNPASLWRIKGIVRCVGHGRALAVHGVRQWLEITPLEAQPPQESVLVLIGRALEEAELQRGFAACLR